LGPKDGFAKLSNTEMVLIIHPDASAATRRLADLLRDFCTAFEARTAA
jgi:hypothetical protein